MIQGNYEKLLEKIANSAGLDVSEIEKRVEAKRSRLAGLISCEGAAQVIAAELGISFENEKLKLNELLPGMRKVNLVGKVIDVFPVRTFVRNGNESKVTNLIIADETSNIKIVLWDLNHIELIEKGEITQGKVVEIFNASVRDNEVHLGSFSELKLSDKVFETIKTEKIVQEKTLDSVKIGDELSVRSFIVQAFDLKFFNVCPECKKKVVSEGEGFVCNEHGKVIQEKRALINIVLDDGTESIRAVLFHDLLSALGLTALEDSERLFNQTQDLLGKEMIFSGVIRNNKFFNTPEFIVNGVDEVNLDELIKKFEC